MFALSGLFRAESTAMINDTAPACRETPLLMVPTYNERDNVVTLCERLADLRVPLDILFIDDNSPDGTGAVLDELATRSGAMTILHRPGKLGVGTAHQTGIAWAYRHGYRVLITMDADFSHDPAYVPAFLAAAGDADVVVGSRHLQSNSLREWNLLRKTLTKVGYLLTRLLLGMPYDATGAFRLYRLDRIQPALFELVESQGYSFFFESLYQLHRHGYRIREIPIILPARTYGQSKMRLTDALHSTRRLMEIMARRRDARARGLHPLAVRVNNPDEETQTHA